MKKYCALIHGQPVLEATLALRRAHAIRAEEVAPVMMDPAQLEQVVLDGQGGDEADQCAVDLGQREDFGGVFRIDRAAVEDPGRAGRARPGSAPSPDSGRAARRCRSRPGSRRASG